MGGCALQGERKVAMLTINLAKDCYKAVNGPEVLTVWYTDCVLPCTKYEYKWSSINPEKPPIADTYDLMQRMKLPQEEIIDWLIAIYVPLHYFHLQEFASIQKVIGFIGSRGSGKSCSAVNVAIFDWLLRGKPVWSNLDIAVRVFYKDAEKTFYSHRLEALDMLTMGDTATDGLVLVDEVNMTAAEGSRYMSSANLAFAYAMQQIRKKQLSVIWTCQGWMWVDNRTRWQTDFVVACRDAYLEKSFKAVCPGDKSHWRVMDLSGLTGRYDFEYVEVHRYLYQFEVWSGAVWNKPIWQAFNSYELQGEESYISAYKQKQGFDKIVSRLELSEARKEPAKDLAERMVNSGLESFYADQLWEDNNITTRGEKTIVGQALSRYFTRKRDGRGKYYYERKTGVLTN